MVTLSSSRNAARPPVRTASVCLVTQLLVGLPLIMVISMRTQLGCGLMSYRGSWVFMSSFFHTLKYVSRVEVLIVCVCMHASVCVYVHTLLFV